MGISIEVNAYCENGLSGNCKGGGSRLEEHDVIYCSNCYQELESQIIDLEEAEEALEEALEEAQEKNKELLAENKELKKGE